MNRRILIGRKRLMIPIPRRLWHREVARNGAGAARNTHFMTDDHHRVRNFVVDEIARTGQAIAPDKIAQILNLQLEKLVIILDDLEKRMTFLYRDGDGTVLWAYPVTAAKTPHSLGFANGKQLHAA